MSNNIEIPSTNNCGVGKLGFQVGNKCAARGHRVGGAIGGAVAAGVVAHLSRSTPGDTLGKTKDKPPKGVSKGKYQKWSQASAAKQHFDAGAGRRDRKGRLKGQDKKDLKKAEKILSKVPKAHQSAVTKSGAGILISNKERAARPFHKKAGTVGKGLLTAAGVTAGILVGGVLSQAVGQRAGAKVGDTIWKAGSKKRLLGQLAGKRTSQLKNPKKVKDAFARAMEASKKRGPSIPPHRVKIGFFPKKIKGVNFLERNVGGGTSWRS